MHAILARNLAPTCPATDLFGKAGRSWLGRQDLPADERRSVDALIRQLDFHGQELEVVERELAIEALEDPAVARLMTIPGVDAIVALSIVAAVGDFYWFSSPDKLVSYVGLNPKVHQSGDGPANHGRISKAGRAQVRGMLVEAAWVASRAPGPLRAFYRRIKRRHGFQVAVVATARKMTVLCWHTKDGDYAFSRPSLNAHKRRKLELTAGQPPWVAKRGVAYDYNNKNHRRREREFVEHAERAYQVMISHWQPNNPASGG